MNFLFPNVKVMDHCKQKNVNVELNKTLVKRGGLRGPKKYIFVLLLLCFQFSMVFAETDTAAYVKKQVALRIAGKGSEDISIKKESDTIDALGTTNWFQGLYPTDPSMPKPKFPVFHIDPVLPEDKGLFIKKRFPMDDKASEYLPHVAFSLEVENQKFPLYSGSDKSQIAYRCGNLLRLIDTSEPVARSTEVAILDHRTIIMRVKAHGSSHYRLCADIEAATDDSAIKSASSNTTGWMDRNSQGWYKITMFSNAQSAEVTVMMLYNYPSKDELTEAYGKVKPQLYKFDNTWNNLASFHSLTPFLTGKETSQQRELTAVYVNRMLRGIRTHGYISTPSLVEAFGPKWSNVDQVFICFQPANRALLWIEPSVVGNSLKTLLENQTEQGMVPQSASSTAVNTIYTQIPNISSVLRDYYLFTKDADFLRYAYPRFKTWYQWFLKYRNPSDQGIFVIGASSLGLWESLCEYKDNATDPTKESFKDTCNPLTRTPEAAGRPERVFLPDIVACQARMADDLAFLAGELGLQSDVDYFEGEFHRVRDWANQNLWDEKTKFYYPVLRATGEKIMKRSNVAFWMMWAGIPDKRQAGHLVKALFDPEQFYTTIPAPMIALNDPTFNPNSHHWGDGYSWPIDPCHAFDGLLRYGYWDLAAKFAEHYNEGTGSVVKETYTPFEYYHHSGKSAGIGEFSSGACLPLFFQRYLRDYQKGDVQSKWSLFAPEPKEKD